MSNDETFTVDDAREAADRGDLASWVARFLASDGSDNAPLADELVEDEVVWEGPVRLPFDKLHRLAGPPDQPTIDRLDDDDLETVNGMVDSIEDGWEPAPLVVSFRPPQLVVEDGNHRIEALRRAGHDDYWSVLRFDDAASRDRFFAEGLAA